MLHLEYYNSRIMPVYRIKAVKGVSNIDTSNKTPLKLHIFLMVFMSFILLPNNSFAQSNRNLPPGGGCTNVFSIDPTHSLQVENIDMSGLSSFYISFQATDTSFYFEILSDGEFPSQLELYAVDCNGGLILTSELYTDTTGSKSIELYPHDLIINNYYMIKIDQNAQNSVGSLIMAFKNPIPEGPCCQPPKPPCADIMYNGSFEIDDISPTGISLDEKIHLSHGYLLLSSQHNRGDYYHPKGNSFSQPPNTILGNNIYPVTTPDGNDAYAGIFTTYTSLNNSSYGGAGEFREWICGQINTPNGVMEAGTRYYVSMQVHLSDDNLYSSGSVPPGIRFSAQPTTTNSQIDILNMTADIQSNAIITNNTSWHTVDGFYTATGNEHYVTIANFQSDASSFNGGGFNKSYFFIDAISITPADLCCTELIIPDDDWDTGDLLNSQDFAPFINGITLEDVEVNVEGDFIVNSDLTLKKVQFNMSPNSKIIINNGSTLTLDSSVLKVCGDTMWEGVEVINSDAEIIMKNKSEIWDAKIGILSTNGGNYTINNSYFKSNNYGIFVDEYMVDKHKGTVVGTTFEVPHRLLYPIDKNMAEVGIYLYNVTNLNGNDEIEIGSAQINDNPNYFNTINEQTDMKYGVFAEKSSFSVVNSQFFNFSKGTPISGSIGKMGIKIIGLESTNELGGYTPTAQIGNVVKKNYFLESTSAISSDGIQNMIVEGNEVSFANTSHNPLPSEYAISVMNNYWKASQVKVNFNQMSGVVNGIKFYNINEVEFIEIRNNDIILLDRPTFTANTGIYFSSNTSPYLNFNTFEISYNNISNAYFGIDIYSGLIPITRFNNILLNDNTQGNIEMVGITVDNSLHVSGATSLVPVIESNIINRNYPTSNTNIKGIIIRSIGWNLPVLCNEIYNTGVALYFDNLYNYSYHFDAFKNYMGDNYDCFVIANNTELSDVGDSTFPSDNYFDFSNVNFHTDVNRADGSFTNLYVRPGGLPYEPLNIGGYPPINILYASSVGSYSCKTESEHRKSFFKNRFKVNQDTLPLFNVKYTSDTTAWIAKYLYYQSLKYDSIINKDILAFKTQTKQSALGQLLTIEEQIQKGSNLNTLDVNKIQVNNVQERALKEVLIQKLLEKQQKWDSLPTSAFAVLEPIAEACPYEEGFAVSKARDMIYHYTRKRYKNICEVYRSGKASYKQTKSYEEILNDDETSNILVYPNPTSNYLNVVLPLEEYENTLLKLYDINGRLALKLDLNKYFNEVDVKELSKGVYVYYLFDSYGKKLKTDKIIIQ